MARVSSVALGDLPTVIKYIMQQVTPPNAQEVRGGRGMGGVRKEGWEG